MPKTSSLMSRVLLLSLMAMAVLGPAWAQQSPTVRIRGTIEAIDGSLLMVKSREGTDMKVRLTDNVAVFGVAKTAISEINRAAWRGHFKEFASRKRADIENRRAASECKLSASRFERQHVE